MILPPGVIEVVLATSVVTIESVKAPERRIIEYFNCGSVGVVGY